MARRQRRGAQPSPWFYGKTSRSLGVLFIASVVSLDSLSLTYPNLKTNPINWLIHRTAKNYIISATREAKFLVRLILSIIEKHAKIAPPFCGQRNSKSLMQGQIYNIRTQARKAPEGPHVRDWWLFLTLQIIGSLTLFQCSVLRKFTRAKNKSSEYFILHSSDFGNSGKRQKQASKAKKTKYNISQQVVRYLCRLIFVISQLSAMRSTIILLRVAPQKRLRREPPTPTHGSQV